jgi:hypothetical protein
LPAFRFGKPAVFLPFQTFYDALGLSVPRRPCQAFPLVCGKTAGAVKEFFYEIMHSLGKQRLKRM